MCKLAESGLGSFTIALALGYEIVSACKTWKAISNLAVHFGYKFASNPIKYSRMKEAGFTYHLIGGE